MIGDSMERALGHVKDAVKAGLLGGMLFEELGFHYLGPVDGHDIRKLQKYLAMARQDAHQIQRTRICGDPSAPSEPPSLPVCE